MFLRQLSGTNKKNIAVIDLTFILSEINAPLTTPEALQALRQQLDQCRSDGKRTVFPKERKQQAVSLSEDYSPGTIDNPLAISPTSLSRCKQSINDDVVSHGAAAGSDNAAAFVALPTVEPCQPDLYTL